MRIVVDPSTTPTGFGLSQVRDQLCVVYSCCDDVERRVSSTFNIYFICSACGRQLQLPKSVTNVGVYWPALTSDLGEPPLSAMRGWLAGWFGYDKDDMVIEVV